MLRQYFNPKTIVSDTVAGLTLGIESIPDAMASALLAAVNPIHGVYAVMLSTPVGALFASSVFMSVQTTSAMSLVVASVPQVRGDDGTASLLALAIITGIIMVIFGLLKLGSLLRFVPHSVMAGFLNGIAILIILGQLGNLTGYDTQGANKIAQTFDLLQHLDQVHLRTLLIGIATILLIIILEKTRLKSFGIVAALIVASLLVPALGWDSVATVADIAEIPDSLPLPTLPPLSVFPSMVIPALSLALVGLIQGAGVSQNYANPDGKYPDASGDFTGQGTANIAAGLFQGMPVGGSLSATALVHSSGAKSRFANIFAGITIAIALLLFGAAISAIAMPALAGLLIVVGFGTLKLEEIRMVWQTGRIQQVVMVITFTFTLLIPLQYAVLVGVALAVILFVVDQSNKITIKEWVFRDGQLPIEQDAPEVLAPNKVTVLVPFGSLFFAAAATFEEELPKLDEDTRNAVVILNLRGKTELGSTFLGILERYADELRAHESKLMLAGITSIAKGVLEDTGQINVYGRDNIFVATETVGESIVTAHHEAEKWVSHNEAQNMAKN
ncbi:MAG: SulP family inorganic anion transporter [Anaerolineales bacterium]|nr:SulP family inorganic anion transporter [Anaerolineales bacterium]